jgi:hypothetical protein
VAHQDVDRRRLARAVGAEQPEDLAARDLEGQVVDGDDVRGVAAAGVDDAEPVDRQRRRRRRASRRRDGPTLRGDVAVVVVARD